MTDDDVTSGNDPVAEPGATPGDDGVAETFEATPRSSAAAAIGIDLDGTGPATSARGPSGRRGRGLIIGAILVGLVLLLYYAVFAGAGKRQLDYTEPEGPAPAFSLGTIYDKHVNFPDDFAGKPVFVNFWASWCGPCKDEGPVLADAYRRWKGSGIEFLGVDVSDSIKWARAFEEHYGIEYDSAFDPTGAQYRAWGLTGYPETFLVDADGNIVRKKVGAFYTQEEIDEYLSLLAPGFTPEPPGELVIPDEAPPIPDQPIPSEGLPLPSSPSA